MQAKHPHTFKTKFPALEVKSHRPLDLSVSQNTFYGDSGYSQELGGQRPTEMSLEEFDYH